MAVWSTGAPGDPAAVGHLEAEDFYGRPSRPLCGALANGMRYRAAMTWERVPEAQRCSECAALGGSPRPPAAP